MPRKAGRRRLLLLVPLAALFFSGIGGFLALPRLVASRLSEFHLGPVDVARVLVGFSTSVVKGITFQTPDTDDPPWLTIDRITADVSLGRLVRGHLLPSTVKAEGVRIELDLDESGKILNAPRFETSDGPPPTLPLIVIVNAEVEIQQAGRPPFVASGISGFLKHDPAGPVLRLESQTPDWLKIRCEGRFSPDFKSASFVLSGAEDFLSTSERLAAIPFLPAEIGGLFEPVGPIGWKVNLVFDPKVSPSVGFDALLEPRNSSATHASVDVTITDVHGRISTNGKLVTFEHVNAKALGGTLAASGTLALTGRVPKLDVVLDMNGIDLALVPAEWGLGRLDPKGRLSGKLQVRADLDKGRVDLSRTTGQASVAGGSVRGRPIKRLTLAVNNPGQRVVGHPTDPHGHQVVRPILTMISTAMQTAPKPTQRPNGPELLLPSEVATELEVENVELAPVLDDLRPYIASIPAFPIRGRVSGTAVAAVPLRALDESGRYRIRSKLSLSSVNVAGVDVGRVDGDLEYLQGVLKLKDVRGKMPGEGSAGGFRGTLSVGVSPPGVLEATFGGEKLPLAALTAPFIPADAVMQAGVSLQAKASVPIGRIRDVKAWSLTAAFGSDRLKHGAAELTALSGSVSLQDGIASLKDLNARLKDKPITGQLKVGMDGERAFEGRVDVEDWSFPDILDWFPKLEDKHKAEGLVTAHANLRGSLQPPEFNSEGEVRLRDLTIAKVALGTFPLKWRTVENEIVLDKSVFPVFGGSITAEGRFPTRPTRPIQFKADIKNVDSLKLASAMPVSKPPAVTGPIDGKVDLKFDPSDARLTGEVLLSSSKFTHEGVSIGKVAINLASKPDGIDFQATADGERGRTIFKGSLPYPTEARPIPDHIDAGVLAVGYSLRDLTRLAKLGQVPTNLKGILGLNANLRLEPARDYALGLRGIVEARELKWGDHYPLGHLQGVVARDPTRWRLEQINGEMFGGSALGTVWSEPEENRPDRVRFDLHVDRASLSRVFAFVPELARQSVGYGTVHLTGNHDRSLSAMADVFIPKAAVFRVPVNDLRIPVELLVDNDGVTGSLHARTFNARIAGGQVRGDASMRVGHDHSFNLRLDLGAIDLETITRARTNSARPGSGRIHGKVALNGRDPSNPSTYRGRIDLDLDDASIVDIPVLREIDKFLGAARGGLVEDGDIHATLANGKLQIESMTLEGRLLQLHATGTVTLEGDLALDVVVNTNQLIPETGEALVERIPGLRQLLGRGGQATARVTSFLSSRLLKFRIGGTIKNPSVTLDPAAALTSSAVGFFSNVFRLPLGGSR